MGEVSGGLGCMDFDDEKAFQQWSTEHTALADKLPIVKTGRGYHVYFRTTPELVRNFRGVIGKSAKGVGAINLGHGELRASDGCYTILPPSIHPNGNRYKWSKKTRWRDTSFEP